MAALHQPCLDKSRVNLQCYGISRRHTRVRVRCVRSIKSRTRAAKSVLGPVRWGEFAYVFVSNQRQKKTRQTPLPYHPQSGVVQRARERFGRNQWFAYLLLNRQANISQFHDFKPYTESRQMQTVQLLPASCSLIVFVTESSTSQQPARTSPLLEKQC